MDELARLIFLGLAVYRLSELLVIDDGPYDVFIDFRGWLQRSPEKSARRFFASVLTCVYCTGTWLAFLAALAFVFPNAITDFAIIFLAISGLQSLLATKAGRQ